MSTLAVAWALKATGITPTQKLVLIHVADHYNEEYGFAWMGQTRLADVTGLARETVNRALQALEADGWMTSTEQPRLDSGRAATKHYVLVFDRAPVVIGGQRLGGHERDRVTQSHTDQVTENHSVHVTQSHRNLEPSNLEPKNEVQEHVGIAISTSEPQQFSSAKPTRTNAQAFLDTYNAHCGMLPAVRKLTPPRKRAIDRLLKDYDTPDEALQALEQATRQVAKDDYWQKQGYGFDNLLVAGRVTEKAEKYQANGHLTAGERSMGMNALRIMQGIGGVS